MTVTSHPEIRVVLVTAPPQPVTDTLVDTLVDESLVACVNVIPTVESVYRWEGRVCRDAERLLVMKCRADRVEALTARIRELHPYDCPEILALPVQEGVPDYVQWVLETGRPPSGHPGARGPTP